MKRFFDFFFVLAALALLWPVVLALAALICICHGWPVFFCQQRPGLRGRCFLIYKFRTMTSDRDALGNLLPDDQRLTGVGRFLRSTSLDELPELFNVLKGDMSLVGPRPLLMEYLPLHPGTGAAKGLDTVLDAAKLMRDRQPEVCFAFAGSGVEEERLRRRAAHRLSRDTAHFLGSTRQRHLFFLTDDNYNSPWDMSPSV